jgi:hypothetical protein
VGAQPKSISTASRAPTRYREVVLTASKFDCGSAALCNLRNLWIKTLVPLDPLRLLFARLNAFPEFPKRRLNSACSHLSFYLLCSFRAKVNVKGNSNPVRLRNHHRNRANKAAEGPSLKRLPLPKNLQLLQGTQFKSVDKLSTTQQRPE